jgi:putative N6-adenine-specific DNA methylase
MELCALCAVGVEKVLGNELRKLGFKIDGDNKRAGMLFFRADEAGLARAHLWLRTAERLMAVVARFPCGDFDRLFEGMRAGAWEAYARKDAKIVFQKIRSSRSSLGSVPAIQSVAQKAVCERFQSAYGLARLPETGIELGLRLYIDSDQAIACVDLSGDPMSRRGYRRATGPAPLKETIAAALILKAGWKRRYALHDPFCGTGTIPIESALFAYNIPPGAGRAFASRAMPNFDDTVFRREREAALALVDFSYEAEISGTDGDRAMIEAATSNALTAQILYGRPAAGLASRIRFSKLSMEEARAGSRIGMIVTNPPYGERIRDLDYAENLYRQMRHLKHDFPGWAMAVITTHPDFPEHFGAEPASVSEIQNGQERSFVYGFGHGAFGPAPSGSAGGTEADSAAGA